MTDRTVKPSTIPVITPLITINIGAIRRHARIWMGISLMIVDLVSLFIAGVTAILLWSQVRSDLYPSAYYGLIPLLVAFMILYLLAGLYPAVGISPVDELRRLTISTTIAYLFLTLLSFWARNAIIYSRAAFVLSWIFAIVLVPLGRGLVRTLASRMRWWGEPVAIIGFGEQGEQIFNFLRQNPKFGLKPAVIFDGCSNKKGPKDIPIINVENGNPQKQPYLLSGIKTAILAVQEIPEDFLHSIIEEKANSFYHLILVSDIKKVGSIRVTPYDIGGIIGLEVRHNLLVGYQQSIKRLLDLGIILLASPIIIVASLLISILIKLESKGSIFYAQNRIGREGKRIKVWKFRTMIANADAILDNYLKQNPAQMMEWNSSHKLKNDPRITKIGKLLRRASLDELPQLWNVLKGEMSLVGPRPIVSEEIHFYGPIFHLYKQVIPGMTGLWQVSGRNDIGYESRVRLDEYYVRNWSIWMDIYILANTIITVLEGKGAY